MEHFRSMREFWVSRIYRTATRVVVRYLLAFGVTVVAKRVWVVCWWILQDITCVGWLKYSVGNRSKIGGRTKGGRHTTIGFFAWASGSLARGRSVTILKGYIRWSRIRFDIVNGCWYNSCSVLIQNTDNQLPSRLVVLPFETFAVSGYSFYLTHLWTIMTRKVRQNQ